MSGQTPTPKPSAPALPPDLLAGLQSLTSKSKTDTSLGAALQGTVDVTGLKLPNAPASGKMTGDQLKQLLVSLAQSHDPAYAPIRAQFSYMEPGYTSKVAKFGYTPWDTRAINNAIIGFHAANAVNPKNPVTFQNFLNKASRQSGSSGVSYSVTNNIRYSSPTAVVRAPATADLDSVAQKAFASTLGRPPTAVESAAFSKQFQDLALSIGNSKNASKKLNTFAPPADSAPLLAPGQKPAPAAGQVAKTAAPLQDLPNANVAATNFALNTDPTGAAENGLNDAMSSWFSTLAKGGGQ